MPKDECSGEPGWKSRTEGQERKHQSLRGRKLGKEDRRKCTGCCVAVDEKIVQLDKRARCCREGENRQGASVGCLDAPCRRHSTLLPAEKLKWGVRSRALADC